jgi:hypothetical protein
MARVKSHENPLLERGDIYFLYRPAVEHEEVHGPQDVQRLYIVLNIVLKPWRAGLYRLIIIGRKKLPAPEEHNRFWAFVWRMFKHRAELSEERGEQTYETKTRQPQGPAGAPGRGGHLRDCEARQPHAPRLPARAPEAPRASRARPQYQARGKLHHRGTEPRGPASAGCRARHGIEGAISAGVAGAIPRPPIHSFEGQWK